MSEKLSKFNKHPRRITRVLAAGAVLMLSGCGDADDSTANEEAEDRKNEIAVSLDVIAAPIYTQDGRRITFIPPGNAESYYADELIAVIEYCEGLDLMTIIEQRVYYGAAGGVDRSEGHKACEDGFLSPSDFTI